MQHYKQRQERATIDTRLLLIVVILGILFGIAGWWLASLPPGMLWWQAF